MNVIFVIGGVNSTDIKQGDYDGLARQFPGGIRNAFILSFDSNDILSIIRESYLVIDLKIAIMKIACKLNLGMNYIAPDFIKI